MNMKVDDSQYMVISFSEVPLVLEQKIYCRVEIRILLLQLRSWYLLTPTCIQ